MHLSSRKRRPNGAGFFGGLTRNRECIISTGLNLEKSGLKQQKDLDENCKHTAGSFLWSEDCKDKYVQALVEPKSTTSIISLDDVNNSDIDSLVEKITTIYPEAGFKTVKFRYNCNKTWKRRRHIKRKKEWMSNNCLMLRKRLEILVKKTSKIIVIYFMHFHKLKKTIS